MTTSAPKSVTGAAQVVSDVGSKATDMALAPTSDPFGIFTEGYDSSNYGTFDYNMTDYSQYDGSAYNQCINVSETFELFAPVNLSVSVRGCILHSAAKAHLSPQIFQDLLNATAKSAPDSKAGMSQQGQVGPPPPSTTFKPQRRCWLALATTRWLSPWTMP